ncbi:hypothetical protein [Oceanirhabdus sp. W0125-5]|uniref:hypothetical protein n=1 Tax=Oceanirhabdus sp. W0125-5 TaxID=2999116 RepID=UPI0022F2CB99|nr:hypothetical protein [Oceanirhabdus sp. W0125-5]WBW96259.1 hypothetical protein OW730_21580 [Oceanirhabdus sp. W0125-5]
MNKKLKKFITANIALLTCFSIFNHSVYGVFAVDNQLKIERVLLNQGPITTAEEMEFFIDLEEGYEGKVEYQLLYKTAEGSLTTNGWSSSIDADEMFKVNMKEFDFKTGENTFIARVKKSDGNGKYSSEFGAYDAQKEFTVNYNPVNKGDLDYSIKMNDGTLHFSSDSEGSKVYKLFLYNYKTDEWIILTDDYVTQFDIPLSTYEDDQYILDIWYKDKDSNKKYDGWILELVDNNKITETKEMKYSFENDTMGWEGGFADLPINYVESDYSVEFKHSNIPGLDCNGLMLTGNNHSDDLFMYVTKKLGTEYGLEPNTTYNMEIKFDLATNVPGGMMGIGGSPGSSVYVKAGMTNIAPEAKIVGEGSNAYYRMNIDTGAQANSGKDMTAIGNVEKIDSIDDSFQLKPFQHTVEITTNENGEAYVIIGIDSGFEGISELYITNIEIIKK